MLATALPLTYALPVRARTTFAPAAIPRTVTP